MFLLLLLFFNYFKLSILDIKINTCDNGQKGLLSVTRHYTRYTRGKLISSNKQNLKMKITINKNFRYSSNRYSILLKLSNLLVDIKYAIIEFSIGLSNSISTLRVFFFQVERMKYTPRQEVIFVQLKKYVEF